MKKLIPSPYLNVLENRNFLVLVMVIFIGQFASACLLLSLIVSVFSHTGSNFGVAGVVLSFTIPALLLMIFAGIVADLVDRRKIILAANIFIALVVLAIIYLGRTTVAFIPLSFLYFAGNSFFIPASSAATAQVVKKNQLLIANSFFMLVLSGGLIFGFLTGAIINFFFGNRNLLILTELLLGFAVLLSFFLPRLDPVTRTKHTVWESIENIKRGFLYSFSRKLLWLFFLTFAALQGVMMFGATIGPGFYDEIVGIPVERSPIFIFPFIGIGVLAGFYVVHRLVMNEFKIVKLGLAVMGLSLVSLGFLIKAEIFPYWAIIASNILFLVFAGLGAILIFIASRTGMQKLVPHSHQGTVFGANIVLASIIAMFMPPMAALVEVVFGYLGILVLGGTALLLVFGFFTYIEKYANQ